jgi:hypothetical protein
MIDISTAGSGITIFSLNSFPVGFQLRSFADDQEALDIEDTEVAGYERLYDGNIFAFDKTSPILLSVGVIPNTSDDINLKIILQKRKSNNTQLALLDTVTMVIGYADGGRVVLSEGTILGGSIADSLTSNGRKKSNRYHFAFGSFDGFQSFKQFAANVVETGLSLLL